MPFKKEKGKFDQCMELIGPIVKPDRIVTLKKDLDKVKLKIIP